jgi:hypothetical protein
MQKKQFVVIFENIKAEGQEVIPVEAYTSKEALIVAQAERIRRGLPYELYRIKEAEKTVIEVKGIKVTREHTGEIKVEYPEGSSHKRRDPAISALIEGYLEQEKILQELFTFLPPQEQEIFLKTHPLIKRKRFKK